MSKVLNDVLAANEKYAANFGDKGKLLFANDIMSGLIEVPEATRIGQPQ